MDTGVGQNGNVARADRRHGWRRRLAATAVAVAAVGGVGVAPAGAQGVFAGACLVTIDVTYTPEVELVSLVATSVALNGSGTCVMEDGNEYPVRIEGALGVPASSCAAGVAAGTVRISIDGHPDFATAVANAAIVHTAVGATLVLLDTIAFESAAVGAFVQDTADLLPCATSGVVTTTWCGALVFEDPQTA